MAVTEGEQPKLEVGRLPLLWVEHYSAIAYHAGRLADDFQHDVLDPPTADNPHGEAVAYLLTRYCELHLAVRSFRRECHGLWVTLPPEDAEQAKAALSPIRKIEPGGVEPQTAFRLVYGDYRSEPRQDSERFWRNMPRTARSWRSWIAEARQPIEGLEKWTTRGSIREAVVAARGLVAVLRSALAPEH